MVNIRLKNKLCSLLYQQPTTSKNLNTEQPDKNKNNCIFYNLDNKKNLNYLRQVITLSETGKIIYQNNYII